MSGMFEGTFAAFRFYDDSAGEAASAALAAQDANHSLNNTANVAIQLRVRIDETGGLSGTTMDNFEVFYSKNSGLFVALTATDNGDGIRAVAAGLTNGNATTDRSSEPISNPGGGSFVPGEQSDDGIVSNFQLTASNFTEHAYGVEFVAANTADADTFDFEIQGKINITSVVPRITITKAGAPDETADGSPSVTKFTASGTAEAIRTADGSPSITPVESAGVAEAIRTADGSPSITPVESTGVAAGPGGPDQTATGSPSITPIEATGSAERELTADGSPSIQTIIATGNAEAIRKGDGSLGITPVESAGAAEVIRTADGSPSITPVEATGAAVGPGGAPDQTADGSPSVTKFTASGNGFIWPKVYLNATKTLAGATEMSVQSVAANGTSITFDDPVGFPTGSLFLGVENRDNGDVGWIPVTVTEGGPTVIFGSFGA